MRDVLKVVAHAPPWMLPGVNVAANSCRADQHLLVDCNELQRGALTQPTKRNL